LIEIEKEADSRAAGEKKRGGGEEFENFSLYLIYFQGAQSLLKKAGEFAPLRSQAVSPLEPGRKIEK